MYPILRANPISGPNIKCLSNVSPTTWRYRIGRHRVFYEVHGAVVFILTIKPRRDAYR
jgi:mRNA interferase RelE/StbE